MRIHDCAFVATDEVVALGSVATAESVETVAVAVAAAKAKGLERAPAWAKRQPSRSRRKNEKTASHDSLGHCPQGSVGVAMPIPLLGSVPGWGCERSKRKADRFGRRGDGSTARRDAGPSDAARSQQGHDCYHQEDHLTAVLATADRSEDAMLANRAH